MSSHTSSTSPVNYSTTMDSKATTMSSTPYTPSQVPGKPLISMGVDRDWKELDKARFFTFGTLSIFFVRAMVYPANLTKTKMQTGQVSTQRVFPTMMDIVKRDGFLALYRGFPVSIVGAIPAQLIYISMYEFAKSHIKTSLHNAGLDDAKQAVASNLFGGACASLASQFVVVPVDIISQRLMIQSKSDSAYRNGLDVVKDVVKKEGVRGLYRGYFPSLITYLPSSSIWWATNATVRHLLMKWFPLDSSEQPTSHPVNEYDYPIPTKRRLGGKSLGEILQLAISGMCAGAASAILTHPMDTLKTKYQTSPLGPHKGSEFQQLKILAKQVWTMEGWRGYTRGIRARVLSSILPSTLLIFSYEIVKNLSTK